MRSGGLLIGIPLTLLQCGVHVHTGANVDVATVANNFAVCEAVYTADRLVDNEEDATHWRMATARFAAGASTLFYASAPQTAVLAGLVPLLHLRYWNLKPYIAPVKPFFVAALWTVVVYFVPIWRTMGVTHVDVPQCAAFFLSISALSHATDIVDVAEDRDAGVYTPAVLMENECVQYAIALALASAFLDAFSLHPVPLYDAITLTATASIVFNAVALSSLLGFAFCASYAMQHDYKLLNALLRSTERPHHIAIEYSTRIIEFAFTLDEPWRSVIVQYTLALASWGDDVGHNMLQLYTRAIQGAM